MSMIVFIADIVHQALPKVIASRAAMVYCCTNSIDSIYGFQIQLPTETCNMVAWLLAKDRFPYPTNISEGSSKFPFCASVVLVINVEVQVSILSY
jgi:hypothetical protein